MTNESTLVTAVYYSTPQSIMGGRGWDFSYYKPTLYAMSKLAAKKIIVFHDDAQEQNLKNFVKEQNLDTFELINLNLDQLPYYDKIFNLKKTIWTNINFLCKSYTLVIIDCIWCVCRKCGFCIKQLS